jgi:hypothetical protein
LWNLKTLEYIYLHPAEFQFIPSPQNICIHFNPFHASQLNSSLPVFLLKFSMHFPSSIYCMSHSSRPSLIADRSSVPLILRFPTVKIYAVLQSLHFVVRVFCFRFATNGLYWTAVLILSLYCDDWWGICHAILWPIAAIRGNVEKSRITDPEHWTA